jgi:hypothetical protein
MQYALVIGQVMAVVFLAFHDWVPPSSGVVDSLSRYSRSGAREALSRSLCGYPWVFA